MGTENTCKTKLSFFLWSVYIVIDISESIHVIIYTSPTGIKSYILYAIVGQLGFQYIQQSDWTISIFSENDSVDHIEKSTSLHPNQLN